MPTLLFASIWTYDDEPAYYSFKFYEHLTGDLSLKKTCNQLLIQGAAERFGRAQTKGDSSSFLGSVFGHSLVVPVCDGRVLFGTWQGFYLCAWSGQSVLDVCKEVDNYDTTQLYIQPMRFNQRFINGENFQVHVTLVNGVECMETTTFSAKSRGLHAGLATLKKDLPEYVFQIMCIIYLVRLTT